MLFLHGRKWSLVYMKVLLIGFNNQCVTLDWSAKNAIFYSIEGVRFRTKKKHLQKSITFLPSHQEICYWSKAHRLLRRLMGSMLYLKQLAEIGLGDSKTTILTWMTKNVLVNQKILKVENIGGITEKRFMSDAQRVVGNTKCRWLNH